MKELEKARNRIKELEELIKQIDITIENYQHRLAKNNEEIRTLYNRISLENFEDELERAWKRRNENEKYRFYINALEYTQASLKGLLDDAKRHFQALEQKARDLEWAIQKTKKLIAEIEKIPPTDRRYKQKDVMIRSNREKLEKILSEYEKITGERLD